MLQYVPGTHVMAERRPWSREVEFVIATRPFTDEPLLFGRPVVYEQVEEARSPEPTFTLHLDVAQNLMDELWRIGLRPSEGTGSAGALAATQKHLEDMRALVAATLDVALNGKKS